uniref:Uncharacterized protein n=1 Tax=Anguilla anguilla TaxID=7936 RepID=A0A0E9S5Q4_ANGAN
MFLSIHSFWAGLKVILWYFWFECDPAVVQLNRICFDRAIAYPF